MWAGSLRGRLFHIIGAMFLVYLYYHFISRLVGYTFIVWVVLGVILPPRLTFIPFWR